MSIRQIAMIRILRCELLQITGAWWRRERQGLYMPIMSLHR